MVDLSAIAKWPNVPACYEWLSLDRRGDWRLRGERVTHRGLIDFINRQYAVDETGRGVVHNGPQRSMSISPARRGSSAATGTPSSPTPAGRPAISSPFISTTAAACCSKRSSASACSTTATSPQRWPNARRPTPTGKPCSPARRAPSPGAATRSGRFSRSTCPNASISSRDRGPDRAQPSPFARRHASTSASSPAASACSSNLR